MEPKQCAYFFEGLHEPFRPDYVPDSWLVFNAARPIGASPVYGRAHKYAFWQGNFHHGIYYAAINPEDGNADGLIQYNNEMDGYLCIWVTHAEVLAWAMCYYTNLLTKWKNGGTLSELLKDVGYTWDSYFNEHYSVLCSQYREMAERFYQEILLSTKGTERE